MPRTHQDDAEHYRALCPQYPVGHPAPDDRREIDKAGIPTINDCGKSNVAHWSAKFEQIAKGGEANDLRRIFRQQQLFHHIEREQRRHSIKGKALPHFGEG